MHGGAVRRVSGSGDTTGRGWQGAGTTTHELEPLERLLAERACERVIPEFVRRLDLGQPSTVCELFTPDGVGEWPYDGRRIEGPL